MVGRRQIDKTNRNKTQFTRVPVTKGKIIFYGKQMTATFAASSILNKTTTYFI
jgi:hypothetical protein